jgi:pimeloyl-ACP methyl ester carboxylesterase
VHTRNAPPVGQGLSRRVAGSAVTEVEGGRHGLTWTHAEIVNRALLDFLQ